MTCTRCHGPTRPSSRGGSHLFQKESAGPFFVNTPMSGPALAVMAPMPRTPAPGMARHETAFVRRMTCILRLPSTMWRKHLPYRRPRTLCDKQRHSVRSSTIHDVAAGSCPSALAHKMLAACPSLVEPSSILSRLCRVVSGSPELRVQHSIPASAYALMVLRLISRFPLSAHDSTLARTYHRRETMQFVKASDKRYPAL